jgi:hypothetical protein
VFPQIHANGENETNEVILISKFSIVFSSFAWENFCFFQKTQLRPANLFDLRELVETPIIIIIY